MNPKLLIMDGAVVAYDEAKVHILTPAVKYGAGAFEGIRGYWNDERRELFLFRLGDHLDRLEQSLRILDMDVEVSSGALREACIRSVAVNDIDYTVHLRVLAWIGGEGDLGATGPVHWAVCPIGRPENADVARGVSAQVSSWRRLGENAMPTRAKATANYVNSRLALHQAKRDGYDTCVLLCEDGFVSETAIATLFIVRDGALHTPDRTSGILESITRETVAKIAAERFGLEVAERRVGRSELYCAEEAFLCGSGQEIQPILSFDGRPVGDGRVGPITKRLQDAYFDIVRGRCEAHGDWRTPVYGGGKG